MSLMLRLADIRNSVLMVMHDNRTILRLVFGSYCGFISSITL